ncbi:MAG: phenylpyruvate tautomerase MIF-related protein [Oscillospiraceae bacterium]
MPYINTIANVPIPKDKMDTIKARLGELMPGIGKKESQLMVDFREKSPLYFRGTEEPAVILSADVFGSAGKEAYDAFSAEVTKLLEQTLGIDPDRIYIKISEHAYWMLGKFALK